MGSLHIYYENKKQIPTKQLVERNLISAELGQKLLQAEKMIQHQKQDLV
jgi:hypothetical protein